MDGHISPPLGSAGATGQSPVRLEWRTRLPVQNSQYSFGYGVGCFRFIEAHRMEPLRVIPAMPDLGILHLLRKRVGAGFRPPQYQDRLRATSVEHHSLYLDSVNAP